MTRVAVVTLTRRKRLPLTAPRTPAPVADVAPLNRAQAAALLGISLGHLSRLTSGGDVPHHTLSGRPRFFADELLEWQPTNEIPSHDLPSPTSIHPPAPGCGGA